MHLFSPFLQFKDIVQYAQMMADAGKTVIIAALNGNYRQEVRKE